MSEPTWKITLACAWVLALIVGLCAFTWHVWHPGPAPPLTRAEIEADAMEGDAYQIGFELGWSWRGRPASAGRLDPERIARGASAVRGLRGAAKVDFERAFVDGLRHGAGSER